MARLVSPLCLPFFPSKEPPTPLSLTSEAHEFSSLQSQSKNMLTVEILQEIKHFISTNSLLFYSSD